MKIDIILAFYKHLDRPNDLREQSLALWAVLTNLLDTSMEESKQVYSRIKSSIARDSDHILIRTEDLTPLYNHQLSSDDDYQEPLEGGRLSYVKKWDRYSKRIDSMDAAKGTRLELIFSFYNDHSRLHDEALYQTILDDDQRQQERRYYQQCQEYNDLIVRLPTKEDDLSEHKLVKIQVERKVKVTVHEHGYSDPAGQSDTLVIDDGSYCGVLKTQPFDNEFKGMKRALPYLNALGAQEDNYVLPLNDRDYKDFLRRVYKKYRSNLDAESIDNEQLIDWCADFGRKINQSHIDLVLRNIKQHSDSSAIESKVDVPMLIRFYGGSGDIMLYLDRSEHSLPKTLLLAFKADVETLESLYKNLDKRSEIKLTKGVGKNYQLNIYPNYDEVSHELRLIKRSPSNVELPNEIVLR